jgi:hypothetical protein
VLRNLAPNFGGRQIGNNGCIPVTTSSSHMYAITQEESTLQQAIRQPSFILVCRVVCLELDSHLNFRARLHWKTNLEFHAGGSVATIKTMRRFSHASGHQQTRPIKQKYNI